MSSLYPINSHPWNTFAVNAGLLDLLGAVGTGVGSGVVGLSAYLNVEANATGAATDSVTLGITAPIGGSGSGVATADVEPTIFYYGGLPIIITDWETYIPVSPNLITTTAWDQV